MREPSASSSLIDGRSDVKICGRFPLTSKIVTEFLSTNGTVRQIPCHLPQMTMRKRNSPAVSNAGSPSRRTETNTGTYVRGVKRMLKASNRLQQKG